MTRVDSFLDVREILSPGGLIAQSFAGFESRPQQVQMADAVQQALIGGRHLVIESGTGVGKSFAYLIPAIDQVFRRAGKVLISTFTITLQEQLINKDNPFLASCPPGDSKRNTSRFGACKKTQGSHFASYGKTALSKKNDV